MVDATTIPALVERAAERFGSREALVDSDGAGDDGSGDRRLSFAELAAATDEAARAYVAHGLEPGDRVAIWAPNSAAWVVAALGAYRAGGVLTTVNTRFKGAEAAHVIRTAGARLLVTVTDFLDTDYVALLAPSRIAGLPRRDRRAARPGSRGMRGLGRLPRPRRRRRSRSGGRSVPGRIAPDDVAHGDLHVGHHRRPQGRHAATRGIGAGLHRHGRTSSGCRRATATW